MDGFTDDKRFHRFQRIGDIIFVSSKKFPNANRLAQRLVTGNAARYSHVLLCILPGLYVHSIPKNGVQFMQGESPDADFDKKYGTAWAVRRLRRLSDDPELAGRLSWRAAYYLGQSYNWVFLGSRLLGQSYSTSHSFCSELIVRIFNDLNIPIVQPNVGPEKALPVHLDEATQSDDWMEVTSSYRTLFQPPESSEFDRLLDQFLPVPDGRLAYIKMVTGQLKTVAATRTLTTSVNEYVQLMDSLKENLATMSDEERARLMKSIGFEARSIRHIYGDVVDVLFSVDEALSLDEARSKSTADPIHYSQLSDQPMVEIDWHGHLESVDTFLAATGNTLHTALTSIETCAEGIVQRLSGEMFTKGEISEDAKTTVREIVRLGREVLDSIEDYENYGVELVELQTHIQEQFAARPLVHPEPLKLARLAVREVQLRLWLTDAPLRHAFDALDSDPTSFDAAFRAYSSATLCAAWAGSALYPLQLE